MHPDKVRIVAVKHARILDAAADPTAEDVCFLVKVRDEEVLVRPGIEWRVMEVWPNLYGVKHEGLEELRTTYVDRACASVRRFMKDHLKKST